MPLLQDQIEFLLEQVKSKNKIINSLIENLSRNEDVFFVKGCNTKTPENQTNYRQLQNTKIIESKESQNKTLQGASAIKKKKVEG